MIHYIVGLLLAAAPAAAPAKTQAAAVPPGLDAYIDKALAAFGTPGAALAIVKDGKIVLSKGYGVRRQGGTERVDGGTVFGIASNTKAFTAAAFAILADEGKLRWDDPVIKHLPGFQMWDPWVTREMQVSELLPHHSGLGLGQGDLLYFPASNLNRDEIVRRVRYLQPATSFRSGYAYDNILYVVADQLVEAVAGKPWDAFVKERILTPLGMTGCTTTSVGALAGRQDVSTPHAFVAGKVVPTTRSSIDALRAAGGINSCSDEMARWLTAQLGRGQLPGAAGRLFTEKQSDWMWTPQTILPMGPLPAGLEALRPNFNAYGSGWAFFDFAGRKIVTHDGGLIGEVSRVVLVPSENLGIVLLTNGELTGLLHAISWRLLDFYLKGEERDWIAPFRKLRDAEEAEAAKVEGAADSGRLAGSRPSLQLDKYAGTNRDQWFGEVTLSVAEGGLRFAAAATPKLSGRLEHWQHDTFRVKWEDPVIPDAFLTFALTPEGSVDTFRMKAVSPLADFSFDYQDLLFRPAAAAAR